MTRILPTQKDAAKNLGRFKLHAGFTVTGNPNGELRFYRPTGTYLDSTYPVTGNTPIPQPAVA